MRSLFVITTSIVLVLLSANVSATDSWPRGAKLAYIDRCAESMSSQGLPMKNAKAYCTCTTNGMEAEFGMKEYDQMMRAEANPNGGEYDRHLLMCLWPVKTICPDRRKICLVSERKKKIPIVKRCEKSSNLSRRHYGKLTTLFKFQ